MNKERSADMRDFRKLRFLRRFCVNPYKTLRFPLMRMDFCKDWITEPGGDPYPLLEGKAQECLKDGLYVLENPSAEPASRCRMLGQHFPFATYELCVREMKDAELGFAFVPKTMPQWRVTFTLCDGKVKVLVRCAQTVHEQQTEIAFQSGMHFFVTCSGSGVDVYVQCGGKPELVLAKVLELPENIQAYRCFTQTAACVCCALQSGGKAVLESAEGYLDAGVSQADIKCMRYEDGTPILHDGKVFLTASVRHEKGGYQAVLSWNPSGCAFRMEGAYFFDYGDGVWNGDIASRVVYNRPTGEWYVWAAAFSQGHRLCHAVSRSDLRFGISVLDAECMPLPTEPVSDEAFFAKEGDEDPDFLYDAASGKWLLTVCRVVHFPERNYYRYFLFASDDPFTGYTFRDKTQIGSDTGGAMLRLGEQLYFVCGSDGSSRARYHAYSLEDLSDCTQMTFDYDDGGFRGWGTILPIPCGNRTRLVWITFDRHRGTPQNWSYGNLYVYEAENFID